MKRYYFKHTDKTGTYYRSLTPKGELCWQPFKSKAEDYHLQAIIDCLDKFGSDLVIGESVSIERCE